MCFIEADMCAGLFDYVCISYNGTTVHNTVKVMEVISEFFFSNE